MSVYRFFPWLWHASTRVPFFIALLPLFIVLYPLECLYRLGLFCVRFYHKIFVTTYRFNVRVVSVGNLSVGGTGKSVVVRYLITLFGEQKCGVIMRGYGGKNAKKNSPLFVGGWGDVFATPDDAGDEAYALACATKVPVVVCRKKIKAGQLLLAVAQKKQKKIDTLIIDDGYQSLGIARDMDIVLLDARAPFGNNHCLPAGPLREKSLQRATHIVVTHADSVSRKQREQLAARLKKEKGDQFVAQRVIWGRHAFAGLFQAGEKKVCSDKLIAQRFCALAGIGSPEGFFLMLLENKIKTFKQRIFPDHHHYKLSDFLQPTQKGFLFVTTEKDWVKIKPILVANNLCLDSWYVARVEFAEQPYHCY